MSRTSSPAGAARTRTLVFDASFGAVFGLGVVLELLGAPVVGWVLPMLAVAALVVRWEVERRQSGRNFVWLGHYAVLRTLALASVLAAVVVPTRGPGGTLAAVLAAALLTVGVLVEPVLAGLDAVRVPVVTGLPGVPPPVPERSFVPAHLVAQLVALVAGLVLAVTAAPVWLWLLVAVLASGPAVLILFDGSWRTVRTRQTLRSVKGAVRRYRPDLILYTSHSGDVTHQVMMWLPYLQRTGLRVMVVARAHAAARALSRTVDCPLVETPTVADLDQAISPTVKAIFYPNARQGNGITVRGYRNIRHVFLGHGDSDKATSYAPSHAMYDEIFCAGPAAARRYGAHGVHIAQEKFRFVGRPQVEDVAPATRPMAEITEPVVLYAPTWRGYTKETNLSSLPSGPAIVAGLLRHGATVIFRPHPSSLASQNDRVHIAAVHALLAADHQSTGRRHRFGPPANQELDAIGCMNASDAMVSDVSGVASDFLFSTKPLAMVAGPVSPEVFQAEFPLTRGAYLLRSNLTNLDEVLTDFLGPDSMAPERARIRSDYLGDFPAEGYATVFVDAARLAASTRKSGASEPVASDPVPSGASRPATRLPAGIRPRLGALNEIRRPLWLAHQNERFDLAAAVGGLAALGVALAQGPMLVVFVLVLLAAGVGFVPVLRPVIRRRQVYRLINRGAAGRAIGGLAVVAAWLTGGGAALPVALFGVSVAAVTAIEAPLGRIWAERAPASRNLATRRPPHAGPSRGILPLGVALALVIGFVPVGPWVATGLALALLGLGGWIALAVLRRASHLERAEAQLRRAVQAYKPTFVVYVGTPARTDSGLAGWLPYLARLNRRFIIITHHAATLTEIEQQCRRYKVRAPILWRTTARSLESTVTASMSTVFYPTDSLWGKRMVALRNLTHVWLNDKEGESGESTSPMAAMYDQVFVPGQAAIDRFTRHQVLIPVENFAIVGRPQVAPITVTANRLADIARPTVMYAPTWSQPGTARHSSLDSGLRIVTELLGSGVRVLFRPNRFYARYPERKTQVQRIYDLLAQDREKTGTAHLFGPPAERELTLTACFNTSDALICDGPATLYDYLHSHKPFAVVSDGSTAAELAADLALLSAAYVIERGLGNLTEVWNQMRGEDPQAAVRAEMRTYYLGPFPAKNYAGYFVHHARELIDRGPRPPSMMASAAESETAPVPAPEPGA